MADSSSIYLDNHTVTRPSKKSLEAMLPFFKEHWGHAAAPHRMGQQLLPAVDEASAKILQALGAGSSTFQFTSSGAESASQVLLSTYADVIRESGKNHFLTTGIEDSPILMSLKQLKKFDCHTKMLPVDEAGRLRAEVLEEAITPRTVMLSVAMSNSFTGVIQPIADLARVCKEKEILFHVDVSSTLGKVFFSFQDFGIDFLSFEGSLLNAPKGTGGLLIRKGLALSPLIHGSAPFNVPLFVALGSALEEMEERLDFVCTETARLRGRFEEQIQENIPTARLFFQDVDRLPNTSVIAFPKIASELLAFHLQRKGIFATFGCLNGQHLSSILKTCGISPELSLCALSFALSHETTEEEIDRAVKILAETVAELEKYYD